MPGLTGGYDVGNQRPLVTLSAARREEFAREAALIRREAAARVTEMDLLVAALRDHIRDLRAERDRLLAEVQEMREQARLLTSPWFARGAKGQK